MTLTLTVLGCGSSAGVPRPALGWGACDPNNPKNRRRRCSLLVERTGAHGTTRTMSWATTPCTTPVTGWMMGLRAVSLPFSASAVVAVAGRKPTFWKVTVNVPGVGSPPIE